MSPVLIHTFPSVENQRSRKVSTIKNQLTRLGFFVFPLPFAFSLFKWRRRFVSLTKVAVVHHDVVPPQECRLLLLLLTEFYGGWLPPNIHTHNDTEGTAGLPFLIPRLAQVSLHHHHHHSSQKTVHSHSHPSPVVVVVVVLILGVE